MKISKNLAVLLLVGIIISIPSFIFAETKTVSKTATTTFVSKFFSSSTISTTVKATSTPVQKSQVKLQTSMSVLPNGDVRISSVRASSSKDSVIVLEGSINSIPVKINMTEDRGTVIRYGAENLSSIKNIPIGSILTVTGTLKSFEPLTFVAKEVRLASNSSTGVSPVKNTSKSFVQKTIDFLIFGK